MVMAQFGKIESLAGADGFEEFVEEYGSLLDQLGGKGRKVVLLEPFDFEWTNVDRSSLDDYREAVRKIAGKRGALFLSRDQVRAMQNSASVDLTSCSGEAPLMV